MHVIPVIDVRNGVVVRVIDYQLDGVADAEPLYRLVTTILDHDNAPAVTRADAVAVKDAHGLRCRGSGSRRG